MAIRSQTVTVTTTGGDGAATGSTTSDPMSGYLLAIYLDYSGSAPATTDLTVAYATVGGTVYAKADSVTDVLVAPRLKPCDNAAAAITNAHDRFPLNQALTFSLAQSNALAAALVATIWWEEQ